MSLLPFSARKNLRLPEGQGQGRRPKSPVPALADATPAPDEIGGTPLTLEPLVLPQLEAKSPVEREPQPPEAKVPEAPRGARRPFPCSPNRSSTRRGRLTAGSWLNKDIDVEEPLCQSECVEMEEVAHGCSWYLWPAPKTMTAFVSAAAAAVAAAVGPPLASAGGQRGSRTSAGGVVAAEEYESEGEVQALGYQPNGLRVGHALSSQEGTAHKGDCGALGGTSVFAETSCSPSHAAGAGTAVSAGELPAQMEAVPENATAIVVCSELRQCRDNVALVQEIRDKYPSIPLIVILLGVADVPPKKVDLLVAQQAMHNAGADDVLFKVGEKSEVRLAIEMSIARVGLQRDSLCACKAQAKAEYEARLQKELEAQAIRARAALGPREPADGMFWHSVDHLFPGFPQLDLTLPSTIGDGVQVGPCQIVGSLGRGGYGSVYLASEAKAGVQVALKVVNKDTLQNLSLVKQVWRELLGLSELEHPNIVRMHGACQGPQHIFIKMDLAGRDNLFRVLRKNGGRLELESARHVEAQLLSAVAHCHARGLAHRDLKPENIAVSDHSLDIKLLDFGSAVPLGKCCKPAGTLEFMAPEALGATAKAAYDAAPADVWSCGMILAEMLCGKGLLERLLADNSVDLSGTSARWHLRGFFLQYPTALVEALSEECPSPTLRALFEGVLQVSPRKRFTAEQAAGSEWMRTRSPLSPGTQHSAQPTL